MKTGKIIFMGAGHMGGALLESWVTNGSVKKQDIIVVVKTKESLNKYKKAGFNCYLDVSKIPVNIKVKLIVFAVKPAVLGEAMQNIKALAQDTTVIVSVAAGKTVKFIEGIFNRQPIIRIMPNIAVSCGLGVSGMYAGAKASTADKKFILNLMKPTGMALWLKKESDIHSIIAAAGSSPAYIYNAAAVLAKAAESYGFEAKLAQEIAVNVFLGSAVVYANTCDGLQSAVNRIATPGGATEAAVKEFNKNKALEKLFKKAMAEAVKRSKEMA